MYIYTCTHVLPICIYNKCIVLQDQEDSAGAECLRLPRWLQHDVTSVISEHADTRAERGAEDDDAQCTHAIPAPAK